jgi:hypothetical protein
MEAGQQWGKKIAEKTVAEVKGSAPTPGTK